MIARALMEDHSYKESSIVGYDRLRKAAWYVTV